MAQTYIVAIEIGSSKIRGAVGAVDSAGVVDVIAIEDEKLINSVRYGQVQNVDVTASISRIIDRLQNHPRMSRRKITGIYTALGARSLSSQFAEAQVQLPAEMEITQSIVDDLMRQASEKVRADREVLAVEPHTFLIDNKQQINPVGAYGHTVNAKFNLLSATPQLRRILQRVLSERLGLAVNAFVVRPIAEAAAVLTDDEKRLGCMFVDFGAETTTVAIYKNGVLQSLSTLPLGSRNITLDLTSLNYIEERAEEIKKVGGNAMPQEGRFKGTGPDGIDYSEVNNYVHARAAEIVSNILAQADYAQIKLADLPGGIIIVGGGSKLKGFNELLSQQSKLKVRQGVPANNVRISDGAAQGSDAVDVISILTAAARLPLAQCVVSDEPEPAPQANTYEQGFGAGSADDNTVRIGRLDDDDDDDPDSDDYNDADPDDDDPDIIAPEKPAKPKGPSIIQKIRDRIEKMMNENYEEEDEDNDQR